MTHLGCMEKFLILTLRNHKSQWSRPLEFLWLLFSPVILVFLAVLLRLTVGSSERADIFFDLIDIQRSWDELIDTIEERQKVASALNVSLNPFVPQLVVAWAPNDYDIFLKTMEIASGKLKPMQMRQFGDCENMAKAIKEDSLFAGICFDIGKFDKKYNFSGIKLHAGHRITPHFNYSIIFPSELRIFNHTFIGANWMTIFHDDPKSSILSRLKMPYCGGYVGYVREGFIKIQMAITESFLKVVSKTQVPKFSLRRFPIIASKYDPLMDYINRGLAMLINIGFLFPAQVLVKQIIREKDSTMRIFLINMRFGNLLQVFTWYCTGLVYMMLSSLLISLMVKVQWHYSSALLTETPWSVVVLVLLTYNMAATAFCIAIASFFVNVYTGICMLTIIWIFTYLPFLLLWNNPEKTVVAIRYIVSAFPNTVVSLTFEGLIERELIVQKQWNDKGYSLNYAANRISVYQGTWIFYAQTVIYFLLGLYMEVWHTGELRGHRTRNRPNPHRTSAFENDPNNAEYLNDFTPQIPPRIGVDSTKIYEVEPSHRRFRVIINKLCKRYFVKERAALNLFTWNVYENEVTVLLGHNGCGKTTLLKVIGGLLEPNRGTVIVGGFDIKSERGEAAMLMGLGLNDDLLNFDLTVLDQIRFTCRIKGLPRSEINEDVKFLMEALQMEHLKQRVIRSLSPRERSIVNIGCAFAGNSSIILLDDLHSDLDLPTQSLICKLINEEKSKRTILIVSNSTKLAVLVADRIAIMSNGELKCTGSKPFLRNMYGHGFRLVCIKGISCDVEKLTEFLAQHIPDIMVESDVGQKISYVLENKYEDDFDELLGNLEKNMRRLDLVSFRVRETSMEEIFLRFGGELPDEPEEVATDTVSLIQEYNSILEQRALLMGGKNRFKRQMTALIYKLWTMSKRWLTIKILNLGALIISTIFPFAAILLYGKYYQLTPLCYNLTQLHYIEAFVESLSESPEALEFRDSYAELLFWFDAHIHKIPISSQHNSVLTQQDSPFLKDINFKYMFGATIETESITAWFNNIPLHAAPFSLNAVHNAVARVIFNEEACIDVSLVPLPFVDTPVNMFPQSTLTLGSLLAINLSFCFCYVWPMSAIFLIRERSSTFRQVQFLSGARLLSFWLSVTIFDLVQVIFVTIWLILLTAFFLNPRLDLMLICWLLFVVLLAGLSVTFTSYCLSMFFTDPITGYIAISLVNALGVITFTLIVTQSKEVLHNLPDQYQFLTQYTFGEILFKLFLIYETKEFCKDPYISFISKDIMHCYDRPNCCIDYTYWGSDNGIRFEFFIMLLTIVTPWVAIILIELYSIKLLPNWHRDNLKLARQIEQDDHKARHGQNAEYPMDESVIRERQLVQHIHSGNRQFFAVVCENICKRYGKKWALNRLYLRISKGECVGLMGLNGSGKSTLVKLLVGEETATHGSIWIRGLNINKERSKCFPILGCTTQSYNLPNEFTPREIMVMCAMLYPYPYDEAELICEALARMCGFHSSYERPLCYCTTGQYRRLTFALAVMGDPVLACIDSVPAGIDPIGKRNIFQITTSLQKRGVAFLYTTLSPIDTEHLCQRTPVIYKGKFWSIGVHGDYAHRYKPGYQVQVRFRRKFVYTLPVSVTRHNWTRVSQFPMTPHERFSLYMEETFPESTLIDQHEDIMIYYVPLESTTFSRIFLYIRKQAFENNLEAFYITRNMIRGTNMDMLGRPKTKDKDPKIGDNNQEN
ncbi:ATP-binding cassette sub-family A member 3 [Scaptodrosophila lebanonensis]|uniref:ATP-binding cassette sub-family A member 3 n=1 Tax=Drosophila lebanonensis TaxID=7225 RepID=A0A6J2TUD3_DROLE|nr:ATP-binding cassette sub-family A member 3 [Scaptodrosophila lebanonensis]